MLYAVLAGVRVFNPTPGEKVMFYRISRPFYTTEKSINGRRAHNPIRLGAKVGLQTTESLVLFSVVYGETYGGGSRLNERKCYE
ncbi:hypothetical protein [Serratia symbiotica]